jgi:hypothetical protein
MIEPLSRARNEFITPGRNELHPLPCGNVLNLNLRHPFIRFLSVVYDPAYSGTACLNAAIASRIFALSSSERIILSLISAVMSGLLASM